MDDISLPAPLPRRIGPVAGTLVLGGLFAAAVAVFLMIRAAGETLLAPEATVAAQAAAAPAGKGPPAAHPLFHVLLTLAAIVISGQLLGRAFRRVGQPPVIGEVIAGILLGPSFLGRIVPGATEFLLPSSVQPTFGIIAQIGVILYMFSVGLHLDTRHLHDRGFATIAISHAGIVVPFLLGATLALALYPVLSSRDVPFTPFALFLGASMSVTAFPVLARILSDRRLTGTPLGVTALTCAAADDVTAWCLLAFVVGVAQAQLGGAFLTIGLTIAYIALMFLVVRPFLRRYAAKHLDAEPTQTALAVVMVALLLSALATEQIGVHAIFGAFLLGAVIPHDSRLARELVVKMQDLVAVLLLPAYFAFTGMRTQIGLISGIEAWLLCGGIILVATLGKFGGTLAAARASGMPWRESAALGVLMNTRGLMELIVLNIGLDLGILSPTLFAMMVIMALATTMATAPVLRRLWPDEEAKLEIRSSKSETNPKHE
jgi:Kef-type K+ transport system membrane component KefB